MPLTRYFIDTHFNASIRVFENIVGKGEIAHNEQFLLIPQCFLLNPMIESPVIHNFDIMSLFAAEFEDLETGISGKRLIKSVSCV